MNHFEFFGLPVALQVDEAALRRAYLLNSKKFHPDFHTLSDEVRQNEALELSTRNNEAFHILSDSDKRLRYVLELYGLLGENMENAPLPPDFLMEMMDINEALADLQFEYETDRFNETVKKVQSLENELKKNVQALLDHWNAASGNVEALLPLRDYFFKRRYLLRIKENLSTFAAA
ncbi:MAG: iron-sulfur cluster co-chaperone HscB C-terminal domain-containing protein [Saprospiraceae bacterium]|nr:iron-sulfur cluster co-chaperone HscB C-terminal domain-containing protein [Saprospiraceae bacterium]